MRLSFLRAYVREHNIYLWAGNLISELAAIRLDSPQEPVREEPRVLARAG